MRRPGRQKLARTCATLAVFTGGVAASLAVATPSAQSGPTDCLLTVICTDTVPTTLPTLPTTITTVTDIVTTVTETVTTITTTLPTETVTTITSSLPTGPQATTGSTTTTAGSQGGSGSSGQGGVSTTVSTTTSTVRRPSPVAGGAGISLRRFRATVRRVGKRRWLTISFDASMRASGQVRLTIPRQTPFGKNFVARSGRNVRHFALPARAGTGHRQLLVTLRTAAGSAHVRVVIRLPR